MQPPAQVLRVSLLARPMFIGQRIAIACIAPDGNTVSGKYGNTVKLPGQHHDV
jgi:hypothetical protein